MIIRIKVDGSTLTPVICDDNGIELYSLESSMVSPGDSLNVLLPELEPWSWYRPVICLMSPVGAA